ncbi:MAG TPA: hypothetical protein VGK20_04370 [Candidatus Binatia bacterium]|jgi:hypothetical protein
MKTSYKACLVALALALVAGTADAAKKGGGGGGGGGGGVPTNYGCQTFAAGTTFTSPDGKTQKHLLMSTWTCYLCNTTTHLCVIQSPSTLFGWTFYY